MTHDSSQLDPWLEELLADPVTKLPRRAADFPAVGTVIDARVYLRNTLGFTEWRDGQEDYERWASNVRQETTVQEELDGIAGVRPVYEHFPLGGRVLDVGGGVGRVREFLPAGTKYVSTDPWPDAIKSISVSEKNAYRCLNEPCSFIAALAEFQPFVSGCFDWVHMRSMLDHVQIPDLALREAWRVLGPRGNLLVGLYVEGGKTGKITFKRKAKDFIKSTLDAVGIDRWSDHHTWHPTYSNLLKLISDNGFEVVDTYWQPCWNDTVCYVKAIRKD